MTRILVEYPYEQFAWHTIQKKVQERYIFKKTDSLHSKIPSYVHNSLSTLWKSFAAWAILETTQVWFPWQECGEGHGSICPVYFLQQSSLLMEKKKKIQEGRGHSISRQHWFGFYFSGFFCLSVYCRKWDYSKWWRVWKSLCFLTIHTWMELGFQILLIQDNKPSTSNCRCELAINLSHM